MSTEQIFFIVVSVAMFVTTVGLGIFAIIDTRSTRS